MLVDKILSDVKKILLQFTFMNLFLKMNIFQVFRYVLKLIKQEKVLLGYLNNYTVNGIYRGDNNFNQQDIDGDYENFNFAAREKWNQTILP